MCPSAESRPAARRPRPHPRRRGAGGPRGAPPSHSETGRRAAGFVRRLARRGTSGGRRAGSVRPSERSRPSRRPPGRPTPLPRFASASTPASRGRAPAPRQFGPAARAWAGRGGRAYRWALKATPRARRKPTASCSPAAPRPGSLGGLPRPTRAPRRPRRKPPGICLRAAPRPRPRRSPSPRGARPGAPRPRPTRCGSRATSPGSRAARGTRSVRRASTARGPPSGTTSPRGGHRRGAG